MKRILFIVFMAITAAVGVYAQTAYFVDVNKAGGDGTSWDNAFKTIQDALNVNGDGYEIWVAEGIYYPTKVAGNGNLDKDKAFVLKKDVKIYGGFKGGESNIDERDWKTNITILSGDLNENNTSDEDDDAFHVIISSGDVGNACLDGFTISGAYNTINTSGNINVNGNSITRNYGGGIYIINSSPSLKNLIIENNQVYANGGGIYIRSFDGISIPTLTDVTISKNTSSSGGGVYNESTSSNTATSNSKSSPILTNVTISENTADIGGGIYNFSTNSHTNTSTINTTSIANPELTNVKINNNTSAGNGGGMYNRSFSSLSGFSATANANDASDASPIITNAEICGNKSSNQGGGIFNTSNASTNNAIPTEASSSPVLTNVLISGNLSHNNSSYTHGSGIYNHSSAKINTTSYNEPVFTNVTISSNAGSSVIYHYSVDNGIHNYNHSFNNCIILGNYEGVKKTNSPDPTYKHCIVQGFGYYDNTSSLSSGTYLVGDIFEEPKDASFTPTTDGNYRLKSGSFAINKGDNDLYDNSAGLTTDLDNHPRIYGNIIDLGAYEHGDFLAVTFIVNGNPNISYHIDNDAINAYTPASAPPVGYEYKWYIQDDPSETIVTFPYTVNNNMTFVAKLVPVASIQFISSPADHIYNRLPYNPTPAVTENGISGFSPGDVTYSYYDQSNIPVISPTNAGVYKVIATYSDNIISTYDYTPSCEVAFEIKPKQITITAENKTKEYMAVEPELTFTCVPGLVSGDTFINTGSLLRDAGEAQGTYNINIGTIAIEDGNGGNNYKITFVKGVFTITAGTIENRKPTRIINQPVSANICLGSDHALFIFALGTNLSYQWFLNERPIQGATGAAHFITNADASDYGTYYITVYTAGNEPVKSNSVYIGKAEPLPENLTFDFVPEGEFLVGKDYYFTAGSYSDVTFYEWSSNNGKALFWPKTGLNSRVTFTGTGDEIILVKLTHSCGERVIEYPVTILEHSTSNTVVDGESLTAYPNPVSDRLTLKGLKQNDIIRIYTLTGNTVAKYKADSETLTVDITQFNPGLYYINANGNTLKIIKK